MRNTKGQMHVLEVLLVGVLFTSAVNVAVNILPTSDADNSGQKDLYFSGMEILELMDTWEPSDSEISAKLSGISTIITILAPSSSPNVIPAPIADLGESPERIVSAELISQ